MSEPPVESQEWPTAPYALVLWRRARVANDGHDEDDAPDWAADIPTTVTLVPSVSGLVVYTPEEHIGDGRKITVRIEEIECRVNEQGYLVSSTGIPIRLLATDDPRLSVTGWTWSVKEHPTIRFAAPSGATISLSDYILAPSVDQTRYWVERIPALIDLVEDLTGITNITEDNGDLLITMSDDTEYRFTIPSADWPTVANKPEFFPPVLPLSDGPTTTLVSGTEGAAYTGSDGGGFYSVEGYLGQNQTAALRPGRAVVTGTFNEENVQTEYGVNLVNVHGNFLSWPIEGSGTIATREWVNNRNTGQVTAVGRPDIPATTPFTGPQLNLYPIGTEYISTNELDGVKVWRKDSQGLWQVVSGDTGWRIIANDWAQASGTFPTAAFKLRRVNNEIHVRVDAANNTLAFEDAGITSDLPYSMCPAPMVMDLYTQTGTSVNVLGKMWMYYDRHIYITLPPQNVFWGSGVFPVSIYGPSWPTTSDLQYLPNN